MLFAVIFYSGFFFAFLVLPAGAILVALLFLNNQQRLWERSTSALTRFGALLRIGQLVHRVDLRQRFPKTAEIIAQRLDPGAPWGLPATTAGIIILLGVWLFLGVLQDIVARDPLTILNVRLHNAVPLFRTNATTWLMLVFTQLGSTVVLSLLCVGAALLALARNLPRLAATFLLALVGTGILSATLKALVGHPRPTGAIVGAYEASFPSGHMLSGAVVYGLIATVFLASRMHRGIRALGTTTLVLVVVGIGLSRLYLGVHWPSDILGSLALAIVALTSLLFFLHFAGSIHWVDHFLLLRCNGVLRMTGIALLFLAIGGAFLLARYTPVVSSEAGRADQMVNIESLQKSMPPGLPRWSEDLIGERMEPISLVIVGSEDQIVGAFLEAGWMRADLPTPRRVMQGALAILQNRADLTGPATPAFFADRPQKVTLEKPDMNFPSIRRRHHVRLWQTNFCLSPNCREIWVATASFDLGIELSHLYLPIHRIDPAIDHERSQIVADLIHARASYLADVPMTPAVRGRNADRNHFHTDGFAALVVLP